MANRTSNTNKTGTPRIFGLTIPQLEKLSNETSSGKLKAKIANRIRILSAK